MTDIRTNWTREEIAEIYKKPLLELVLEAAEMHKKYHKTGEVQVSSFMIFFMH